MRPTTAAIETPKADAPPREPNRYPLRDVLVAARRVAQKRSGDRYSLERALDELEEALDHCRHL